MLVINPDRSTGVPLNPQFRNPPPGANPPQAYDDPVTLPAGDIADNAYYKRDIRRSYPRLSLLKQTDVVQLLSAGSGARSKDDGHQIEDTSTKQMMQVQEQGEEIRLSTLFSREKDSSSSVFGAHGLPPFPTGMSTSSLKGKKQYVLDTKRVEGYPEE